MLKKNDTRGWEREGVPGTETSFLSSFLSFFLSSERKKYRDREDTIYGTDKRRNVASTIRGWNVIDQRSTTRVGGGGERERETPLPRNETTNIVVASIVSMVEQRLAPITTRARGGMVTVRKVERRAVALVLGLEESTVSRGLLKRRCQIPAFRDPALRDRGSDVVGRDVVWKVGKLRTGQESAAYNR